jgi:hypothetical protein
MSSGESTPPHPAEETGSGTDLDRLGPARPPRPPGAPTPPAVSAPLRQGKSVELKREDMRGEIARWILGIFVLIVVGAFATVWFTHVAIDTVLRFLELFVGPIVGIVGAVTGFYFGSSATGQGGGQQPPTE